MMINLYVIDDHFFVGTGLAKTFHDDGNTIDIVGSALNLFQAVEEIPKLNVNIILLDLFIRGTDPIINIKHLMKAFPIIPIVIYSYEESIDWQIKMFQEGAKAYISKSDEPISMTDVFHQVFLGKTIIPDTVLHLLGKIDNKITHPELLPSQIDILVELCSGKTVKEIADKRN
ncbi:MAG: response regulator transcription factor, partial [Bacteroidetes bacterium]|nr:response regulator transcription factor [Bacteroidota bacterium]